MASIVTLDLGLAEAVGKEAEHLVSETFLPTSVLFLDTFPGAR